MELKRLKSLVGASAALVAAQGTAEAVWDNNCDSCVSGCQTCTESCTSCSGSCPNTSS